MIIDSIDNLTQYALNEGFKVVANFLKTQPLEQLPLGRTEVNDQIFALVMENELKEESTCLWEAHRKYLDLHVGVQGTERIGHVNISNVTPTMEYNAKDDYQLFSGEPLQHITLRAGSFVLFLPQDVHKTSIRVDDTPGKKIRKIVFKVPVNPS